MGEFRKQQPWRGQPLLIFPLVLNNLNLIIYSTTYNKIQIFVQDEILSTFL